MGYQTCQLFLHHDADLFTYKPVSYNRPPYILPLPCYPITSFHLNLGITGLLPTASATQPPIKHRPPKGVTGPKNFHRCGSNTSKYMLPLNMVMPAVKRPMATVFCGAATEARVRTAE